MLPGWQFQMKLYIKQEWGKEILLSKLQQLVSTVTRCLMSIVERFSKVVAGINISECLYVSN